MLGASVLTPGDGCRHALEMRHVYFVSSTVGSTHEVITARHRSETEKKKTKKTSSSVPQACLRRQEYRRDPNEKKRDQPWGQETNFERSRFSSGLSSKQVLGTLENILLLLLLGVRACVRACEEKADSKIRY